MSPESLRRKAANGIISGAKPGKCCYFREDDLADYLRSLAAKVAKVSWGDFYRRNLCHSTKETMSGGLTGAMSTLTDQDFLLLIVYHLLLQAYLSLLLIVQFQMLDLASLLL